MDMTSGAGAQRVAAIIQGDLRDRPKEVLASRLEREDPRKQHRCDARAQDISDPTLGGDKAEYTIGGRDQTAGEADPLRLIAVEQPVGCATGQDRRQLPGQIDGVANSGVHALAAGGTVDVRGIAEQEGAALAEMLRHSVMHMIGRKPVYSPNVDLEVFDRPVADILEFERIGAIGTLVAHRAD